MTAQTTAVVSVGIWFVLGTLLPTPVAASAASVNPPWPPEKWPDFWLSLTTGLVSGMIVAVTVGAVATFWVERRLDLIQERRRADQVRVDSDRQWAIFKQRLRFQMLEQIAFRHTVDLSSMAVPRQATTLVRLIEGEPIHQWERSVTKPDSLLPLITGFPETYSLFMTSANQLRQNLVESIDQYHREGAVSDESTRQTVSRDTELMFCVGLIVKACELDREDENDRERLRNESPSVLESFAEFTRVRREKAIAEETKNLLWRLQLPQQVRPELQNLYGSVRTQVDAYYLNMYCSNRRVLRSELDLINSQMWPVPTPPPS